MFITSRRAGVRRSRPAATAQLVGLPARAVVYYRNNRPASAVAQQTDAGQPAAQPPATAAPAAGSAALGSGNAQGQLLQNGTAAAAGKAAPGGGPALPPIQPVNDGKQV